MPLQQQGNNKIMSYLRPVLLFSVAGDTRPEGTAGENLLCKRAGLFTMRRSYGTAGLFYGDCENKASGKRNGQRD